MLDEAGAILSATLDYEQTCNSVTEVMSRALASYCLLELLDDDGQLERPRIACRSPAHEALASELQRLPLDARRPHLGSCVFDSQQPLLLNQVSSSYIDSISQNEEHRRLLLQLSPRAILARPLRARGALLGVVVLVRTGDEPPFAPSHLALAEDLARAASMAIEHARLYRCAQHAIRMRDEVLGTVAHDLRNPLTAMLLQLRLFRRRGGEPERRSQANLEAVLREGERLNRLIQDLLDVARIDAKSIGVKCASLRLGDVLDEAFATHQLLCAERSLTLRLDVDGAAGVELLADRHRLLQALSNVLENAIKFTPAGGVITLRAVAETSTVELAILDTGPGVAPHQLPHLFERFWQAQKGDRRGAGLGLSIAKAIVEAHGGRIWAEAASGSGGTFRLSLPRPARRGARRAG